MNVVISDVPTEKKCYESVSRKSLGETGTEHYCTSPDAEDGYIFSKAMLNPGFIGVEDIKKKSICRWAFRNLK